MIDSLVANTIQVYVEFGVENGDECNTRHLRQVLSFVYSSIKIEFKGDTWMGCEKLLAHGWGPREARNKPKKGNKPSTFTFLCTDPTAAMRICFKGW